MPDNPSKLQNVQLTGEPSDGLCSGVVKPQSGDRGAILDGGIPSAAEQNVERRPCDCEKPIIARDVTTFSDGSQAVDYRCCICGKRHLP